MICAPLILAVAAATLPAAPVVHRPAGPVKNCTEGQCHATQKKGKFLHGPTALGACDVCHVPVDETKHTYRLKQKDKALCDFCHVEKTVGKVMHKPVEEGQCLACHDPHGSSTRLMLRSERPAQLCATCHKDVTGGRKHVHGPVASGSCSACHNGHRSEYPKLLAAQGRELCMSCHDQMRAGLKSVKFMHKPVVEGDCQQCHEVHASNAIMQLKQEPVALCVSCHTDMQKTLAGAKYKHSAVTSGPACIGCHTPHGSDLAKLTRNDMVKSCLTCHDKPVTAQDKRVVAAVPEVAQKDLYQHGPIREGNCAGCHTLHGGQVSRLLAKPYPETFYESFSLDKYALCFNCHDKQLVLLEKTAGLTRFRNGDVNLHFVHVNKSERGRSCRACHSTHASTFPQHIRQSVPFGKWEMPINYKQTETGGSCAPGCHGTLGYDRDKPLPPTTKPVAKGTP